MRILVFVLLLFGAQFSLTAFAPTPPARAWLLWPFAEDSKPRLNGIGGLPKQPGSVLTPLLAGISGLAFLAAACALFGVVIPANWWLPLVIVAVLASACLHVLYFGALALVPLATDAVILWGTLLQGWSVPALSGIG